MKRLLLLGIALIMLGFATVLPAQAQWGGERWGTTALPLENTAAPDFTLLDSDGTPRSLHDWQGDWLVLYFYPMDFTSGCTIEARRFQQDLPQFQQLKAQVVGISADAVATHRAFCDDEGLQFTLLSDPDGSVSSLYGSWMGDMALRNTFIIDPAGTLRMIYPIVSPARHSQEVLAMLKQLQA